MPGFAQKHMEQHGWSEGKGLGRNESGMKSAIKVKLKNNTMGLGHDQGAEFTFHWWDHIFNKAANSFKVNESEDGGVQLEKCEGKKLTPLLISNKRGLPTRLANKSLMYGTFVKAGTYDSSKAEKPEEDEVINEFSSDSESDDDDDDGEKKGAINDTVDKMDKLYYESGLTGHKAARHGHSLNGKLQRLQQQEQRELPKSPPTDNSCTSENSTTEKVEIVDENCGSENNVTDSKKKKKKKKKVVGEDTDKCDGDVTPAVDEVVKEKTKKKKRKNISEEVSEVDSVTLVGSPTTDMSNIHKKSKKHKLNEIDENLVTEEAPKKKKKKKKENNRAE